MRHLPLLLAAACCSCAASRAAMPSFAPLAFEAAVPAAPLVEDHFARDKGGAIGEAELRQVLAAPVFLEPGARVGIVPVAAHYAPSEELPTAAVPGGLATALEETGLFELATEVSTEWPADRGLHGLRELAARYRADYLLLYRHRFALQNRANPGAWSYLTVLASLFVPGQTVDAAGVLEATLYDVKSGTLLFTVHERIRGEEIASPPRVVRVGELLQDALLKKAAPALAQAVVERCRKLAASRPAEPSGVAGQACADCPRPNVSRAASAETMATATTP